MAASKTPPEEPDILKDVRLLTLQNAKEVLSNEHLKIFEMMMKRVYAEGFLNGQKSMTTAVVLMFTLMSFGQSGVVTGGGNAQNISYTIGGGFVELQIPKVEKVVLDLPKVEAPVPAPKPVKKKVSSKKY